MFNGHGNIPVKTVIFLSLHSRVVQYLGQGICTRLRRVQISLRPLAAEFVRNCPEFNSKTLRKWRAFRGFVRGFWRRSCSFLTKKFPIGAVFFYLFHVQLEVKKKI